MKVLFISHVSNKYGAGRALLDLIDGLIKKEVECYVILPRQGPLIKELQKRDIKYSILPLKSWVFANRISLVSLIFSCLNLLTSLRIAVKAYYWKADIIYTNTSVTPVGALAAFILRKPHIWHVREFVSEHYKLCFSLGESLSLKLMQRLSFRIVLISKALRQKYLQHVSAQKLRMIYDAVSVNKILKKSENKRDSKLKIFTLAIIGLVNFNKGQMDLVLAVANLIKQGVWVKLKIVGDWVPEYFEQLKQAIAQNQITKYVEFTGYINDIESLYNSVDIILVCSCWEAFGRVTIESMLFKKPIIGARSGATPELIHEGFNGLLYEPGNYQELAEKIKYLINHPEEAKQMGENGFKEASEKYAIAKYADEIYNIFEKAIKE